SSGKGTLPILGNIMIAADAEQGSVGFTGTDLTLNLHTVCDAEVEASGSTTLPWKTLQGTVIQFPAGEMVSIELGEETVTLQAGEMSASLLAIPASEFPLGPQFDLEGDIPETIIFDREWLVHRFSRVACAAADSDDRRPTLA